MAMTQQTRRAFFADVGKGVAVAALGTGLAADLGVGFALGDEEERLTFGTLEPLVALMQDTPADRLLPVLTERLRTGTELRGLVAAAALANARVFGGEDYVGFHTLMALGPAYHMAQEGPADRRALPVLKVLYRNTSRIHERSSTQPGEVLRPVRAEAIPRGRVGGEVLREQSRRGDMASAERTFAALAGGSPEDAFNHVLYAVQDATEVHRVVLPYRAWDLIGIIGREQAHTLLRQSVRYCVRNENPRYAASFAGTRAVVPRLLNQYRLLERRLGGWNVDDAWIERMCETIFRATADAAADAAAAALADGVDPDAVGQALSLAANQLVLRDNGRPQNQSAPNRPAGSVHGDSIGVHSCDAVNAWRNMARMANDRNRVVCLILGAYQVAQDRVQRGGEFLTWQPYPRAEARDRVRSISDPAVLLREAEEAIRAREQPRAAAAVHRYGELNQPVRPALDLLLRYAVSEDGALHAEKYYRTAVEEFNSTRPAFRWRHLVSLARVTASAYGQPAPGYADACRLLRV
jgi:hypothetical protein